MALLKCSRCGKVMTYQPADTAGRVKCSGCGTWLRVPASSPPAAPRPVPSAPPAAADRPRGSSRPVEPSHSWKWVAVGSLCVTAALLVVLMAMVANVGRTRSDQRYLEEHREQLLALKADAERLALANKLPEAHAKYRELEQLVGGRTAKDPALWDLLERAKQDQDRVYAIMLATMNARAYAPLVPDSSRKPASTQENATRRSDYRGFQNVKAAPAPTTQPVVSAPKANNPAVALARPAEPPAMAPATQPAPKQLEPQVAPAPGRPTTRPAVAGAIASTEDTDARIGQAIKRGADFLIKHFEADQIAVERLSSDTYLEGLNALCVYALLQSGQAIKDERLDVRGPFMRGVLTRMKEHQYATDPVNPDAPVTYAHSLRAAALAVYNRAEDRQTLEQDVRWLVLASSDGAYTYDDQQGRRFEDRKENRYIDPQGSLSGGDKKLYYLDPEEEHRATWLHNGESVVPARPTVPLPPGVMISPEGVENMKRLYLNRRYTETADARWDNSNTQYGVLGVWAGAEVGVEVPQDYWMAVERHWTGCQLSTGEWYYSPDRRRPEDPRMVPNTEPTFAMTVAGIASLFVTHDYLDAAAFGDEVGRRPFSPPLARGMLCLERTDFVTAVLKDAKYLGYNLFGLERVGLASGFKYFGSHDWYGELSARVLAMQRPDGSWCRDEEPGDLPEALERDAVIDTAYMLLFLARGRHPVMMNKLRFDGSWCNRPRELANLSKFTGRELERQLNWQVVSFQREWHDWMDAPILYIASHQAPKFTEEQYQQLRSFVQAGGLIFTHADAGSSQFNAFAIQLARKLFPDYEMANLPATHELYSLQYKMASKPPLKAVSNGSRLLMVHSPQDFSTAWQVRNGTKRENWELPINLFVYATGRADLRNRLSSPYIATPTNRVNKTVNLARLKYAGNWNPEPYAFERFSRYLRREADCGLNPHVVELRDLKVGAQTIAHLTGNAAFTATDAEVEALRQYVEAGGVVLIDACGGSNEFAQSAVAVLNRAFPGQKLAGLDSKHRLFSEAAAGMEDLSRPLVRSYASGKTSTQVQLLARGKGKVLFSSLDLTTGLLGTNTWGILGYQPAYAQKLVKNIVLWVSDGARE
ncbi:MAG: DUF4159 domain-containing protein [Bacillota bacterium]